MTHSATTTMPSTVVLGELLLARRAAAGLTVDMLATATGFPAERISAVEAGRHDLTDVELDRLLKAYPIDGKAGRFSGLVAEVSLDGQWVAMRRRRRSVGRRPAADRNLVTYLSLVYEDRSIPLGSKVSLKSVDLSLLRPALAIRRSEVDVYLQRVTNQLPSGLAKNRSLLAVAAVAGVAVAAGAVVLIPNATSQGSPALQPGSDANIITQAPTEPADDIQSSEASHGTQTTPGADVELDIGTALVIERDLSAATEPGEAIGGSVQIDPRIDIGTAVVIERSAEAALNDSQMKSPKTTRGPPPSPATLSNSKEQN